MIIRILVALLLLAGSAQATTRYADNNGNTSGTCTSSTAGANGPCRLDFVLPLQSAGDTLILKNNTYTGANNMLNLESLALGISGSSGNPITVQAETDGGVFINGELTRNPFVLNGNSWWIFEGFDVARGPGNFGDPTCWLRNHSDDNTIRRVTCANTYLGGANYHTVIVQDSSRNLFEDVAIFGTGRNSLLEYGNETTTALNTYRRMWLRWEGYRWDPDLDCGAPPFQIAYYTTANSTYENIITVFSAEQTVPSGLTANCFVPITGYPEPPTYGSVLVRNLTPPGSTGYKLRGWMAYGYTSPNINVSWNWVRLGNTQTSNSDGHQALDIQDMFIDGRSQTVDRTGDGPIAVSCGASCPEVKANRVTSLRGASSESTLVTSGGFGMGLYTNINECTSIGACPNFYTGDSPGTGARNCFRYVDRTLTSTPLWPWPMDDRIKAALAREHAAGLGGTALSGTSGTGYAAATVTSEIVSRYGTIPTACNSAGAFTPSFPVASDFPSIAVLDTFDRANSGSLGANWTVVNGGSGFTIASNVAAAPSDFTRELYSGSQATGTFHEVAATWTTAHPCCGLTTMLVFGASTVADNAHWRLYFNRQSGGNTLVAIYRIDSGGVATQLGSDVNLGTDFSNNDGFGIRVDGSTITAYWKWNSDGQWYRLMSVTDATLPSGNVYGGFAGISPAVINDFVFGPAPTIPPTCPPICPPNPAAPCCSGVGRFGTTFPGVR